MWDGLDRFTKTQELNGRLTFDLQCFQQSTTETLTQIDYKLQSKINEDYFDQQMQEAKASYELFATNQV